MSTASEAVIRRIQGLMALSTSPNEHEANAAAEKASVLLTKYNLALGEVKSRGTTTVNDTIGHVNPSTKHGSPWIRSLWQAVAKLNFCDYAYSSANHRTHHWVVGSAVNSTVTVQMAEYLTNSILDMSKRERKIHGESARWQTAFRDGCGRRVTQRLRDRYEDQRSDKVDPDLRADAGTANLPALYEQTGKAVSAYMRDTLGTTQSRQSRSQNLHSDGRRAGRAAGDRIGIDTQIGGGSSSQGRIS